MKIKTTTILRWPTSWFFLYKKNKIKPFPIEKSDGGRGPPSMKTTRDFTKPHRRTFFFFEKERKTLSQKKSEEVVCFKFPCQQPLPILFLCVCVCLIVDKSLSS